MMMNDGYVKGPFGIISILPHIPKVNLIEVFNIHFESQHVAMAKLHDLPTQPTIDRVGLVLGTMVLCNEKCVFQLKGVLAH